MKIANYRETREYLESFIKPVVFERITEEQAKIQDPLLRMRYFLSLLGDPQNKFKSILVGGTAGKGSTAYLISHILKTAGYKTGLTISPHLEKINERIQINGEQISDQKLIERVSSIVQTIELMKKTEFGEPSYFEILVALAFQHFVKEKVDIAVVEVGLGGRYDATNTLHPLISVLTNVSLDHTQILGKTVEQIAREKIGIIKECQDDKKRVVITGVKQPSVIKIVEGRCKKVGAKYYRLKRDFDFRIKKESLDGTVFDLTTTRDRVKKLNSLRLSLLGEYQVENASLAIETVLQLGKFGFDVDERYISKALKTAFFPGRFEIINLHRRKMQNVTQKNAEPIFSVVPRAVPRSSALILDGAHNPTKMKAFIQTLKKLYPKNRKIFVVAFKKDKDIKMMLKQILSVADSIIVTEFYVTTDVSKNAAMPTKNIKYQISLLRQDSHFVARRVEGQANIKSNKNIKTYFKRDSKKALKRALKLANSKDDLIIMTGSLYLVGEIRNFFSRHTGSGNC